MDSREQEAIMREAAAQYAMSNHEALLASDRPWIDVESLNNELRRLVAGDVSRKPIFFDIDASIPGFPTLDCSKMTYVYGNAYPLHSIKGLGSFEREYLYSAYGKYTHLGNAGVSYAYRMCGREDGSDLGRQRDDIQLEAGFILYNILNGHASVYTYDNPGEPIHIVACNIMEWDTRAIFRIVMQELTRAEILVVPTLTLPVSPIPYPYNKLTQTAMIGNEQINVPVVGAVADGQSVIYLHAVGNKTALKSIWASLNVNNTSLRHGLTFSGNVVRDDVYLPRLAVGTSNYYTYSEQIDGTPLYRLLMIDKAAVDSRQETTYLLIRKEEDNQNGEVTDEDYRRFASRLNDALSIPILHEWGKPLYHAGIKRKIVTFCQAIGDVKIALALKKDKAWYDLVASLIQDGTLAI